MAWHARSKAGSKARGEAGGMPWVNAVYTALVDSEDQMEMLVSLKNRAEFCYLMEGMLHPEKRADIRRSKPTDGLLSHVRCVLCPALTRWYQHREEGRTLGLWAFVRSERCKR